MAGEQALTLQVEVLIEARLANARYENTEGESIRKAPCSDKDDEKDVESCEFCYVADVLKCGLVEKEKRKRENIEK